MPSHTPRILFLDAYDSFSNNITSLLATTLHADVHVLPIDTPLAGSDDDDGRVALQQLLRCYDAVVCGPGPGSPDRPADTGLMRHVWAAAPADAATTPALGICLGFQSLVAAHGGRIRRLRSGGLHGMVRAVATAPAGTGTDADADADADTDGLFAGVPSPFRATLYHSLGADVGQDAVPADAWPAARWQPRGDLQPLAWLEDEDDGGAADEPAERLLMGVRHRQLPFWGLQYHPESVCTDAAASRAVLANWFRAALQWNADRGRQRMDLPAPGGGLAAARQATRPSLLSVQPPVAWEDGTDAATDGRSSSRGVVCRTIALPDGVQVPDLVETLMPPQAAGTNEPEHIVLDSSSAAVAPTAADGDDTDAAEDRAIRGRFSIVALGVGAALRVEHRTGDAFVTIRRPVHDSGGPDVRTTVPLHNGQTIWQLLAAFHAARRLPPSASAAAAAARPFVGGFMGYVTYEQGLHDIGVEPAAAHDTADRPGLCFAWVVHSLVVDHVLGLVHVQHLYDDEAGREAAAAAVDDAVACLQRSALWTRPATQKGNTETTLPPHVHVQLPDLAAYEAKVRACQEHIAAGDAYELCLTDEARVTVTTTTTTTTSPATPPPPSAWHYYRTLRTRNPAPFASYVRLGGATLVSSSPERFLWFGRRPASSSSSSSSPADPLLCSMRPMKGTVRRSAAVATPAQAAALLRVPKEEAENLMIVDLVRHDLHGVCGPGAVAVPRLLQVEPYGHVFQMVSVVEGALSVGQAATADHTGLDVLAASLPPGSMTGAPKKRSCVLLRAIETAAPPHTRTRSLYAGVVGYLCATGQGDWSVTIRSLFRWDDETTATTETWHVGAGGAVTILSTPEGERDEMLTKLAGPLSVFDP